MVMSTVGPTLDNSDKLARLYPSPWEDIKSFAEGYRDRDQDKIEIRLGIATRR